MKKLILLAAIAALSLVLISQEISHETLVINIEIPVRVFKKNTFVDNLTIDDFEVYEDGILQKIEAVYLVKKASVVKREEKAKRFTPKITRNFIFVFEIREYLPKIGEVLDYFFDQIILAGDTLKVVTPVKSYDFKREALGRLPKERIVEQLKGKIRQDAFLGSADYRSLVKHLRYLMESEGLEAKLLMIQETLRELRDLRNFDEQRLMNFADYLKSTEGQKYVFMFYQKETTPIPENLNAWNRLEMMKSISFDVNKIKRAFSDSSISSHFLYITKVAWQGLDITRRGSMGASNTETFDQSAEIFSAFKEMAQATGGLVDSSDNVAVSFQKAVAASENYYLIYYAPKSHKKDGKFRKIKVKVKNQNYRILHRAGYFMN